MRVLVAGVEPGARGLPAEVTERIARADLLAGSRRHLALVPGFRGEILPFEDHRVTDVVARVAADPNLRAVLLASGDPGFFGAAALVLRRFPRDEVEIVPAISSMQLAFARAGEPWSDARFASLHGRPLENLAPLLGARRIGVFTDAENSPTRIASFLEDTGWDGYEMVVAEDLGLPTERVTRGPVSEFRDWTGSDLNVVLLLRNGVPARPLGPGIPDGAFSHDRGLITKREVRAVALGLLDLPEAGVLWDVGAGSGSVSVEACLLRSGLRVYAVEKTAEGVSHIRKNRRRFRAAGLVPVEGEAPGALKALPDPDRVFVGGSGGRLAAVLDVAWGRLRPGGVLLVAAVLLETQAETLAWTRARSLEPEITEVRASRSRPVAGRHRMVPENPVCLVRLEG